MSGARVFAEFRRCQGEIETAGDRKTPGSFTSQAGRAAVRRWGTERTVKVSPRATRTARGITGSRTAVLHPRGLDCRTRGLSSFLPARGHAAFRFRRASGSRRVRHPMPKNAATTARTSPDPATHPWPTRLGTALLLAHPTLA
jgi:hypothetical protein